MEEGFVPDTTFGGVLQSSWHPGPPETTWLSGVNLNKDATLPVTAYRCITCGFLKFYAKRS
jgi:hypothetical protein